MSELLQEIYPLRLAPVSPDTDRAIQRLCEELPFVVHEYPSGEEHNGWTVPNSWYPVRATITRQGRLLYDGMEHPLGVISYSKSFHGTVTREQLRRHLSFHPSIPDSLVYHCDYYYKPWKRSWGLTVPRLFFDALEEGQYQVDIETVCEPGTMKVLDCLVPGDRPDTVILNAHNCHAAQANDDIAGVVVAMAVTRRLAQRPRRRYSYRVIIAPEHLGTVFYLAHLSQETVASFRYAIFLEMLGNDNRLALQESFTGRSLIDLAAHHHLRHHFRGYHSAPFRKIVGNDETVWEAPGYEIPCISLSRFPYREYHSSFDDAGIIHEDRLEEAVAAVTGILDILETNTTVERKFRGLVALSNPKYDLYVSTVDPSIRRTVSDEQRRWNHLMDCVIRYFDGKTTILDMALKHDLAYDQVLNYLGRFEEKGLVSFGS